MFYKKLPQYQKRVMKDLEPHLLIKGCASLVSDSKGYSSSLEPVLLKCWTSERKHRHPRSNAKIDGGENGRSKFHYLTAVTVTIFWRGEQNVTNLHHINPVPSPRKLPFVICFICQLTFLGFWKLFLFIFLLTWWSCVRSFNWDDIAYGCLDKKK